EIYQSGSLFRAMWPRLLQAYAIRALVAGADEHAAQPSIADVTAFLDAADAGQLRGPRVPAPVNPIIGVVLEADPGQTGAGARIRASAGAIATEIAGENGTWVHRSYVAKLTSAEATQSPEAALVAALDEGRIEGYPLANLDPREPVVPRIDRSRGDV